MDDSTIHSMPVAELSLMADARSPGMARRFLLNTLTAWGKPEYRDDAALLLSELVTNAALHAKSEIVVRIELLPGCLHLGVTDSSPRHPTVRHYSEQSTTGRGLALVNALALRWGVEPHVDGSKTVWAEVGGEQLRIYPEEPTADIRPFPDLEEAAPGSGGDQGGPSARLRAA
jgi:anti-sigma regulatory factor (Ser/Thr protein kinase)